MSKVNEFLKVCGDIQLSDHFKMKEFFVTNKEDLQDFSPVVTTVYNMIYGCTHILEPIRLTFGHPLIISSGYRSSKLNMFVGGVSNSQHLNGCAADILFSSRIFPPCDVDPMENEIIMLKRSNAAGMLPFDQLIIYRNRRFFHISWCPDGQPRGQIIYK